MTAQGTYSHKVCDINLHMTRTRKCTTLDLQSSQHTVKQPRLPIMSFVSKKEMLQNRNGHASHSCQRNIVITSLQLQIKTTCPLGGWSELGGRVEGIDCEWVTEVVLKVLEGSLACHDGLNKESKHGEHGLCKDSHISTQCKHSYCESQLQANVQSLDANTLQSYYSHLAVLTVK